MHRRAQPRRIVQRAGADAERISRSRVRRGAAPDPCPTIRADLGDHAPAVGLALERAWGRSHEAEGFGIGDEGHRERTAGQALAFRAVAGVDELLWFADLMPERAALAASGLGGASLPDLVFRALGCSGPSFAARNGGPRIAATTARL